MGNVPELDMRWRRLWVGANGPEAIDAIRKPLFVLLLMNAAAVLLIATAMVVRADWPARRDVVTALLR